MNSETLGNQPAYPVPSYVTADGETFDVKYQGLTIRQAFAMAAMQGYAFAYGDHVGGPIERIPGWAVRLADLTLEALAAGGSDGSDKA